MKAEKIGVIGTDSGMTIVIDPCYLKEALNGSQEQWTEFLKTTFYPNGFDKGLKESVVDFNDGIVFSNCTGDGGHKAYAILDKFGRVRQLIVDYEGHWGELDAKLKWSGGNEE